MDYGNFELLANLLYIKISISQEPSVEGREAVFIN